MAAGSWTLRFTEGFPGLEGEDFLEIEGTAFGTGPVEAASSPGVTGYRGRRFDAAYFAAMRSRGVPVWEHNGIICTGETYKSVVKLTFCKGASLDDPSRLFNASLDGRARRAIDIRAGLAPVRQAWIEAPRSVPATEASSRLYGLSEITREACKAALS